jgi:hypothetical protein
MKYKFINDKYLPPLEIEAIVSHIKNEPISVYDNLYAKPPQIGSDQRYSMSVIFIVDGMMYLGQYGNEDEMWNTLPTDEKMRTFYDYEVNGWFHLPFAKQLLERTLHEDNDRSRKSKELYGKRFLEKATRELAIHKRLAEYKSNGKVTIKKIDEVITEYGQDIDWILIPEKLIKKIIKTKKEWFDMTVDLMQIGYSGSIGEYRGISLKIANNIINLNPCPCFHIKNKTIKF